MSRKTVNIAELIEIANNIIKESTPENRDARKAIQYFVTDILHRHGVYAGFNYLDGWPCEDDSRVYIYEHPALRREE